MFSPDALRALNEGDLSDLELSSDDDEQLGFTSERESQCVRVGADVINHNQREVFPPDSDDDEGPSSSWIGMNDQDPEFTFTEVPTTEVDTSNENILQNITPKQNIRWRHRKLINTIASDWFPPISIDPRVESPLDYYYRYVPKQLFVTMAEMTNLYATFSNRLRFKPTTADELEILFGLHLASGIFRYPCLKMYWETTISIPLFSENMARDRFFELRNNLHLVDNTTVPAGCNDAFYKVRPIFDAVRYRCLELPLEKELCVDEQIVPFTGKHIAKQYIKGKPCPWGLKIFFLCGKNGQAYDFILYQSSGPELDKNFTKKIGYGAAIVLHLTKRIGESKGHELYFDNYFSSYHILQILKQKGIMAACTARVNRFANPSLITDKEINKKPRGFSQEVSSYDDDVTVVKWLDSKVTHLASNFIGIGDKDFVRRWCKKEKKFIEVERPEVVKKYNHAMGGVDLLDQLMSYYRTFIKSKKWTLRMIFHASDLAVVQAFREYQIDSDLVGVPKNKQLTLLHFRRRLADSLVLRNKINIGKRGRPSGSSPAPQIIPRRPGEIRPEAEIARDGVGHFPAHDEGLGTRCKRVGCTGRTRIKCIKCKIHLCLTKDKNCFLAFHT
nr:piggyBac transposable element-derived protein 3-like [Helicoverpa armigera]